MTGPQRKASAETLRRGEEMAWGSRPNSEARRVDRPKMRLLAWRKIGVGNLIGLADVELPIGLKIFDIPVIAGRNGRLHWAAMPSKAQLDRERRQKVGADGKPLFAPVCEWRTRALGDRFSAAVVDLVRAAHPSDLGEAE
jgi:hypothetical protein